MAKKRPTKILLDASAFIAGILGEPGARRVERAVDEGAAITSVNLAESLSKLIHYGFTATEIQTAVEDMRMSVLAFDASHVSFVSHLQPYVYSHNLSLADRVCLAVALKDGYSVLTADNIWKELPLHLSIELIR